MRVSSSITCRGVRGEKHWASAVIAAMLVTGAGSPVFVPVANAQSGGANAVGFVLDSNDLRFILKQIQIAENHASGEPLLGPGPLQVNEPRFPFGLRTVSGQLNHLVAGQEKFGGSDQVFPRLAPAQYNPAEAGTTYNSRKGTVIDSQPRIISNLISDQTAKNPAAAAVAGVPPDPLATEPLFIENVASDVGLSAPFNAMFTFFGQFFDHGLDLVNKGKSGAVVVPLQEDDPLFVPGGTTNFMVLSRATNLPGPDGVVGDDPATEQDESADDILEDVNQTTPFVDQNQTYTSHPSHQVFLREYALNAAGKPVSTGRMIDGGGALKNIGNWAEVKAQAASMLGIRLVDTDIFNVPLLVTDPYGRFVRGPNGYPQVVMTGNVFVEGNPAAPIAIANAVRTGHAFLDDIAHNAVPNGTPDSDGVANAIDVPRPTGTYDDELLAAHFLTGDGRGNENIALTAVHTIFHAEHNRLHGYIKGLIEMPGFLSPDAAEDAALRASWQAEAPQPNATPKGSGWDYGERLFQAARFVTEMQYQHLVFEEFARTMVPSINPFVGDGINFHTDINPAIPAEFAHQAYRLGHSMLTEVISRTRPDGTAYDIDLLDGFLNPLEFNRDGAGGVLTAAQAAGAIFQGGTRQAGNDIDEFVTDAVRNNLLGLPLDLGVLNLARGRSEGVPPLNAVRRALHAATDDSALTPYENWDDFGFNLKHRESLVNFIAAYGVDPHNGPLNSATTLAAKREAAQALMQDPGFMFAPGSQTGVERIDLWIGGLAEKIAPFGSMLGTTFNNIFENVLEGLQDGDRFYYLERLDGLNLLSQMEGNSFAELIARNTPAGSAFSASVFARPDFVFNLDSMLRVPGVISDDPTTPENEAATPGLTLLPNGTIRYTGPAHVIWNGRTVADSISSSEGDDTIRGGDGNDRIEGGAGNDQPIGGAGDDIITDTFGDDVIKGGPGNDAINGGAGPFDLLQGNEGNDFVVGGNDLSEVFGGPGNDVIYMGKGLSESIGGGGDDWMEGTDSPASIAIGDDNNQLQNDPNGGHDILLAGPGDMDFDAEGGDDIMVGNVIPTHRFEGMLGFDWATYRGEIRPVDADMLITGAIAVNAPLNENRDRYDLLEGLSGTNFNDLLRGDNRDVAALANDGLTGVANGHVLDAAGIARITGLGALLPAGTTSWGEGNIILGGAGSDIIEGRGGNDIIDGDAWLNVQLEAPDALNGGTKRVDSLKELRTDVFAGRIKPGQIQFRRTIEITGTNAVDVDTAVFSGAEADYTVTPNADGSVTVEHTGGTGRDGRDQVRNIERLQFTDVTREITSAVVTTVPSVVNQLRTTAATTLANSDLTVGLITFANSSTIGAGRVISQSPVAGGSVPELTAVALVVSLGRANVTVPGVMGMTQAEATIALSEAELGVGAITKEASTTIGVGQVIRTNPAAGASVPPGTAIALVVSSGFPTVQVPGLVGLAQADALAALDTAGLTAGAVTEEHSDAVGAGVVLSQNPQPEAPVAPGTSVSFVVSLGPATVQVPDLVGLPEDTAKNAITSAGLVVGAITTQTSATVPAGDVISQNPAAATAAAPGSSVALVVSSGPLNVEVPNVVGQTQAAATSAITGASLVVGTITQQANAAAAGTVLAQSPTAGTSVAPNSAVNLTVSSGPVNVSVPNVVGQTETEAATTLSGANLTVGTVTQQANAAAAGTVLAQSPTAGTSVAPNSAVNLTVSSGPAPVSVPNVVGQTQTAAATTLSGANLTVGTVTQQANAAAAGTVLAQSPTAGTSVAPNSAVNLTVSSGPAPIVDAEKPVAVAPAQKIDLSSLAASTVNVRLTWSATDNVGVTRYEVQRSTNNGSTWANEAISTATSVAKTIALTPGTSYRFRVRAFDAASNVSDWATGNTFTIAVNQESAPQIAYVGTWTPETITTASGGAQRFASAAGATATFSFTGSGIAWAAVKHNTRGRAEVFVDGASAGVIDLFQTSTTASMRRVVFERTFPSAAAHTIQVRVLGTKSTASTGTRVDVDAFVVLNAAGTAPANVNVPNVVGQTQAAATTAITGAGLIVGTVTQQANAAAAGTVLTQNPTGGTSVTPGSAVNLTVSSGPANVNVPNVVGQTQAAATTAITGAGLIVGTVTQQANAAAAGTVLTQNPTGGTSVTPGSAVNLTVSSGPAPAGDTVKPVATAPAQKVDLSALGTSAVNVRLSWSATDNVGVTRYELQRSTNNGSTWTNEGLSTATSTTKTVSLTPGTSYVFRVRALDAANNASDFATAAAFTLALHQETAPQIAYVGTWTTETITTASGGAQRFASAAGATATFTFTGRAIAWASVKHNTRGRAEVFVDGVSAGVIDLFQTSTTASMRRVVFERTFATSGPHTLQVRVLGTKATASTSTRVDVDAFVTIP